MTDNQTIWTRNTSIERYAAEHGIAVVMPNAHLDGILICNMVLITLHFSEELPTLCERFFPCISNDPKTALWQAILWADTVPSNWDLPVRKICRNCQSVRGFGVDICARLNNENFYPTLGEDIFGDPWRNSKEVNTICLHWQKNEKKNIRRCQNFICGVA